MEVNVFVREAVLHIVGGPEHNLNEQPLYSSVYPQEVVTEVERDPPQNLALLVEDKHNSGVINHQVGDYTTGTAGITHAHVTVEFPLTQEVRRLGDTVHDLAQHRSQRKQTHLDIYRSRQYSAILNHGHETTHHLRHGLCQNLTTQIFTLAVELLEAQGQPSAAKCGHDIAVEWCNIEPTSLVEHTQHLLGNLVSTHDLLALVVIEVAIQNLVDTFFLRGHLLGFVELQSVEVLSTSVLTNVLQ
ncbi:ATP synthase delta subunit, putative [Babesia ovis]|uniref:ATP synthase delta subunit, putative n=1 Tax=Babesia ovis TaxID=5869 RepID=A0A9W5TAB3_BABOV|nr:ATP synthase delta subunit, putative [Babesia ovis]